MTIVSDSARTDLEALEPQFRHAYLVGMAKVACESLERTPEVPAHVRAYARDFLAACEFVKAQP